jgi:hypothetical protein
VPAGHHGDRVAIDSASSWSWVTNTKVVPTCDGCVQLDLHLLAQLQVEGAERFVEEEHAGRFASARARATRWAWPPDIWVG